MQTRVSLSRTSERDETPRSRRTRTALAHAAHAAIARTGEVDAKAIAADAGVSPATFYTYFASHDDALAAALDLSLDAAVGASVALFTVETLLEQGLAPTIERLHAQLLKSFRQEAPVLRSALARLTANRAIRDVYRHHQTTALEHLERQIRLAQKAQIVRAGDPGELAVALLVSTQGLNNPLLVTRRPPAAVVRHLARAASALLAPESA